MSTGPEPDLKEGRHATNPPQTNFSTTLLVDQTPDEVFAAINNVRGWWGEDIEGNTDSLGEFTYRHEDVHRCTIRVTELVPGERVVWHVVDNFFAFTEDETEWKGTRSASTSPEEATRRSSSSPTSDSSPTTNASMSARTHGVSM